LDPRACGFEAVVIRDLLAGEYTNPVRVVAFNVGEGWSRDVTLDVADEVALRFTE